MLPDPSRFVPTLTEIVNFEGTRLPVAPPAAKLVEEGPDLAQDMAEQVTRRLLHRVDTMLTERLAEAVRLVVMQHVEALLPALRAEIVGSVTAAMTQAIAEEFATASRSPSA